MRLLMISHGYPPTVSGVTVVVQKIAREMVRRGHEVTVVAASDRGDPYEQEDQGVRVMRVHSRLNPFWSDGALPVVGQTELRRVVIEAQPDVVHSHETALLSLQLLRLDADRHIPLVASCHYLPRFVAQYVGGDGRLDDFAETVVWEFALRLLNQFDHAVFPTRTQQVMFSERGLSVPFTVISNGVDLSSYRPPDGDRPQTAHTLPDGPRILFVSRLARDKRIDVLIRAMLAVPDAHLILVGRGDDEERLAGLTADLRLTERVHFLGFVAEEDLPSIYRECDLFAIASTCEVQSIPTLQAAASGLPIVGVDAAALPELIDDGINGLLVPPEDPRALAAAVSEILGDPERARLMGKAGVEIAREHAEEASFAAHERLYQHLADGHGMSDSSSRRGLFRLAR